MSEYGERGDNFAALQPRLDAPPVSACPLCGQGEAGSEHLVATAAAWDALRTDQRSLREAVFNPRSDDRVLA
eukprot:12913894-Prorocentrum_lima.AAC.1